MPKFYNHFKTRKVSREVFVFHSSDCIRLQRMKTSLLGVHFGNFIRDIKIVRTCSRELMNIELEEYVTQGIYFY